MCGGVTYSSKAIAVGQHDAIQRKDIEARSKAVWSQGQGRDIQRGEHGVEDDEGEGSGPDPSVGHEEDSGEGDVVSETMEAMSVP